jgi:hypothetical protein
MAAESRDALVAGRRFDAPALAPMFITRALRVAERADRSSDHAVLFLDVDNFNP